MLHNSTLPCSPDCFTVRLDELELYPFCDPDLLATSSQDLQLNKCQGLCLQLADQQMPWGMRFEWGCLE